MHDSYVKLAKILRTKPEVLEGLCAQLTAVTGKEGIAERIVLENEIIIKRTLQELGLAHEGLTAEAVDEALIKRLVHIDGHLYDALDRPDLSQLSKMCGKLCEVALSVNGVPRGYFLKREKAVKLLEQYPPTNLLEFFGYTSVAQLIEEKGFSSVFSALRFTQTQEWMHAFFDTAYNQITPEDFEEREVELKVLETEWLGVAEKFLKKKHHNVSHLKELGIIFIVPLVIDKPGETLRMFTLVLHYLNEVPFYSRLFRRFALEPNFAANLKSLLRGDVPEGPAPEGTFRIVQRYLTKDDENDFRLLEPHVNPEAEHWYKAEADLARIAPLIAAEAHTLGFWHGLDFVGGFFQNNIGEDQLVSFDLIDLTMTVVDKGAYLYHQQEALWFRIFVEYYGVEKLNQMIEDNIIKGFIPFT